MAPHIESPSKYTDTGNHTFINNTTSASSAATSSPSGSPSPLPPSSFLYQNRYPLLATGYFVLTSAFVYRVSRSPLSTSRKWEQYETIFKGTTLGAVIVGVGISGGFNRKHSELVELQQQQQQQRRHHDELREQSGKGDMEKAEARKIVREGGSQRD